MTHVDPDFEMPSLPRPVGARAEPRPEEAPVTLEQFVVLNYRRLLRLAALVCLDGADAQDAVQNALLRAWRSQDRLRDKDRMKPWLDAIVVREAIRTNDRRRSWLQRLTRHAAEPQPAPSGVPSGAALDLANSLASLPTPQRVAVALHYEAGYTVAETAALLQVPHETVRSRLRLARGRLRNELAEEMP
jgi:RNA polymerase sigma-70 factor (ECF subfamily)